VTLLELVKAAMQDWPAPSLKDNGVIVPTHCILGSGGILRVHVEQRMDGFVAHDDGAAIDEFAASGGENRNALKLLRTLLAVRGFVVTQDGAISSPRVNADELAPAIVQVANASREAADYLLGHSRPAVKRDFRRALRDMLEKEFSRTHIRTQAIEVGASTRQHKFDFAIDTPKGVRLLVDAVSRDSSAINASVIRNLDLKNLAPKNLEQRIVYDDAEEWTAADLNLLQLGARAIPFSRAYDVLGRFAA
jgi:hypothetical protein